jgi:hypothetical protein
MHRQPFFLVSCGLLLALVGQSIQYYCTCPTEYKAVQVGVDELEVEEDHLIEAERAENIYIDGARDKATFSNGAHFIRRPWGATDYDFMINLDDEALERAISSDYCFVTFTMCDAKGQDCGIHNTVNMCPRTPSNEGGMKDKEETND